VKVDVEKVHGVVGEEGNVGCFHSLSPAGESLLEERMMGFWMIPNGVQRGDIL